MNLQTRRGRYAALSAQMSEPHRKAMREHLDGQKKVGEIARTVVDHPGWQVYVDHIDANLEALERRKAALVTAISKGDDLGERLGALKLQLRGIEGEIVAYQNCKGMVPQMVEAGARAIDALSEIESNPAK